MPSNLLTADTSFPNLTDSQSTDEKFGIVTNYLYMLLEQLRYSLSNLGISNFNDAELESLVNLITEPVYIQLQDVEGNVSSLYVEANNLTSRIQSAEGEISTLQQTATSLTSQITTLDGDVSTLQQTATSLTSKISNAEGEISTLQQTTTGLSSKVSNAEGNITSLQQTVGSLTTTVSNQSGEISTLRQTVNSISLGVSNGTDSSTIMLYRDGVAVSSKTISFSGVVTFSDLSTQGQTVINGGNVSTGTISGVTLRSLSGLDSGLQICYGTRLGYEIVGGVRYDTQGAGTAVEARDRMFIYTNEGWAMKLESGASASFVSEDVLYLEGKGEAILAANGGAGNLWLRGTVYINGVSLENYIKQVVA